MRNRIIHGYDTVNIAVLWGTLKQPARTGDKARRVYH